MNRRIKAVIFDMDGVLIGSEIEYIKLFQQFLTENGVSVKQKELHFLAGAARYEEDRFMAEKLNMDISEANARKERFYAKHKVNYRAIRKEYVIELLEYLKQKQITIALASSSPIENIQEVLKQCEITEYFSFYVSGEMFVKTKPDPEIYEYTLKQLGYDKKEIWVIEDSSYGIEAAKRAGLYVLALWDPILQFDIRQADGCIHSLKEVIALLEQEDGR